MLWRSARLPCATKQFSLFTQHAEQQHSRPESYSQICRCFVTRCFSWTSPRASATVAQEALADSIGSTPQPPSPLFTRHSTLLSRSQATESPVKIAGLVRSIRKHKKVAFAHIADGSTYQPMQAIFKPEDARDIQNGTYVELRGIWRESIGRGQSHEVHVEQVLCIGHSNPEESPIQKKSQTVDHLRNYPHLRLRTPLYSMIARVRNQAVGGVHDFYSGSSSPADEAVFVQPPLITSSDCEGAGEVFTVTPKHGFVSELKDEQSEEAYYFRTPKYLTVSSQLHLEAFSAELGDVWTLSPAFRAEESDTARHLAELTMLEAEFRSITELDDLTNRTRRLIQHVTNRLLRHPVSQDLLEYYLDDEHRPVGSVDCNIRQRWDALQGAQWQSITFADAIADLKAAANKDPSLFKSRPSWKMGLQLEHERWLTQHPAGNKPIFVTHYPRVQKPFYMLPSTNGADPEDPGHTVACFDLLLPYGACEVVGGSLREHRLEHLIANMRRKGLLSAAPDRGSAPTETPSSLAPKRYPFLREGESLNSLSWYADLRRFGSSPHGGFGLGFDRLLMYLTGVTNVRDIVGFPRTFGRADC